MGVEGPRILFQDLKTILKRSRTLVASIPWPPARVIWRSTPHVGRWSQSDWGLEQKHTARAGQGRAGQHSTAPRIKKKWRKPRVPEIWSGECYHQARSVGEKRYLGQHQFITENCPSPNPHNKCLSRGRKYPSCI